MILSVNGNPVNGIDVAKYQGDHDGTTVRPDWLWFLGVKATDIAKTAEGGVDPKFAKNRKLGADLDVPWRTFYTFLRDPRVHGDMSDQMALFCQTVGKLSVGESVMLDWEDRGVTALDIAEAVRVLDVVYPGRWMMYVNDVNPDMTSWIENNKKLGDFGVPLVHPDWRDVGWQAAEHWDATIWQVTVTHNLPSVFPNRAVDVDWVRKPHRMDRVCGRISA